METGAGAGLNNATRTATEEKEVASSSEAWVVRLCAASPQPAFNLAVGLLPPPHIYQARVLSPVFPYLLFGVLSDQPYPLLWMLLVLKFNGDDSGHGDEYLKRVVSI